MTAIWTFIKGAWKAVTAAVTTAAAPLLAELFQELGNVAQVVILAAIGAVITYMVPNIKS